MQKILLTGALCLMINGLSAQPWMDKFEGQPRVKLQDVVNAYKADPKGRETDEEAEEESARRPKGAVKEGNDYHFERWRWYWEQHLDNDGYMISPLKNYQEWEAYKKLIAARGKNAKTAASSADWVFQGPTASPANGRGLGRIQKITFHPTDSNIFWVGTAGGGAWKTANSGSSWTCMTDMLPVLGIADITYNPLNTSVIYLCTGDRDASDNSSIGVLKTTDGGITWNQTGFQYTVTSGARTNSLLVNPLDTSVLLLSTSTGIYQSRNGGTTWSQRTPTGAYRELMYRPGDTAIVYATSSNAGIAQIYRSGNGGATWTQVTNVSGGPSRVSIAVSPAAPNMVKAIFANANYGLEGIYHSSDTGRTFTKIFNPGSCAENYLSNNPAPNSGTCDGQAWYDLAIAVSPLDSNKVVIGGVNTWYSTTGGLSWQIANQWWGYLPLIKTVHADKHYMAYQPLRPTVLYEGNDGGIYRSSNLLSTAWTDLTNGLGITQFYRVAVANHSLSAIGGAQDNGSKRIVPGSSTIELTGGDGMNCEMDPVSPVTYYTAIQYGDIYRNGTGSINIADNIPGQPVGDWITPYKLHPKNGARIVAGFDKMYLSNDQGDSWTAISPKFSSVNIKRVAFSPSSLTTMYALVANTVRRTVDNGANWTSILSAPGGTISDIIVDKNDKQRFWVTYSGYGGTKVAQYDTVSNWQVLNDTLPNVPVNCITIDTSNGTIYIGTDVAVFYRDTTMKIWGLWNTNLPPAEVTDLDINYSTGDLWAATYGRGMWKTPKFNFPPSTTGISIIPYADDVITVSPNPTNGIYDIQTSNASLVGQQATVKMLDLTGRTVWSAQRNFSSGGILHIDAAGLPRATYILDVTAVNGMKAKTKLVVY